MFPKMPPLDKVGNGVRASLIVACRAARLADEVVDTVDDRLEF